MSLLKQCPYCLLQEQPCLRSQLELTAELPVSLVARRHDEKRHKLGQKVRAVKGVGELVLGGAGGHGLVQASLRAHLELQGKEQQEGPAGFPA